MDSTIKISVLGHQGTGKTQYINYFKGQEFDPKWFQKREKCLKSKVEVFGYQVEFSEMSPSEFLDDFNTFEEYLQDSQGVMIFVDPRQVVTIKNAKKCFELIKRSCGKIPVIVCVNFKDMNDSETVILPDNYPYFHISCKNRENLENPILSLISKLK